MTTKITQQGTDLNSAPTRRMVRASLMGSHTHQTADGRSVHVWQRGLTFLARGRWQSVAFGETLGRDPLKAAARLRKLLGELEDGTYIRPSEQVKQYMPKRNVTLSLRDLVGAFLTTKRAERGRQTARNYRSRLRPVLEYIEQPDPIRRWPTAAAIDRDFVADLKSFLMTYRNKRSRDKSAVSPLLSGTQVRHCLETLRSVVNWALDPIVGKLPSQMLNPFDHRTVPAKASKNPLRDEKLSHSLLLPIIEVMDHWQICHLSWSLILPWRPDEAAGLLVTDVNEEKGWFEFGYRFNDCIFTKEKTQFVLPFPEEFRPLLKACRQRRTEGPLLRSRKSWESHGQGGKPFTASLRDTYERAVGLAGSQVVQAEHDRKMLFRQVLRQHWGGVSEDRLAAEFRSLMRDVHGRTDVRFYDLRHAATQAMKEVGLPHLELRYLTGHACQDILNEYTTLRPKEAMAIYFARMRPIIEAVVHRANTLLSTT
ncbi:MAG: hypothetical protein ACRC8S_13570 [Fimbriiglobus sp.]